MTRAAWWITGAWTLVVVLGAVFVDSWLGVVAAAASLLLFAAGCVLFVDALVRAAGRSRTDDIAVAGLFLLQGGAAEPAVRRLLLWPLWTQIGVATATAAARPFTVAAFNVLAPTFGLGLTGAWAARHGTFARR